MKHSVHLLLYLQVLERGEFSAVPSASQAALSSTMEETDVKRQHCVCVRQRERAEWEGDNFKTGKRQPKGGGEK